MKLCTVPLDTLYFKSNIGILLLKKRTSFMVLSIICWAIPLNLWTGFTFFMTFTVVLLQYTKPFFNADQREENLELIILPTTGIHSSIVVKWNRSRSRPYLSYFQYIFFSTFCGPFFHLDHKLPNNQTINWTKHLGKSTIERFVWRRSCFLLGLHCNSNQLVDKCIRHWTCIIYHEFTICCKWSDDCSCCFGDWWDFRLQFLFCYWKDSNFFYEDEIIFNILAVINLVMTIIWLRGVGNVSIGTLKGPQIEETWYNAITYAQINFRIPLDTWT